MAASGRMRGYMASIVFCQAIVFLRYVALARILGPDQVGLMSILVLTASLFELITDFSVDRYLVVNSQGDDPRMQRVSHGITVVRGALISLMMVATAWPVAQLYGEPSLVPSLMILAAYPVIAAFVHNDVRRVQREMDFRPEAIVNVAAEIIAFVVTIGVALATQSFVAIVAGLIARSCAQLLATHLVATRRYEIGFDRDFLKPMIAFALPLSLNGILLYASNQGDRLIVGSMVGTRELGLYASTLLLIYYPSGMLGKFLTTTSIPAIARAAESVGGPAVSIHETGIRFAMLALAMALGFALVAPFIVPLLYGADFAMPFLTVAMIGMLQAVRFAQQWLSIAFMGIDRTRLTVTINLVRIFTFLLCLPIIVAWQTLLSVTVAVFAAEAMAMLIGIMLLNGTIHTRRTRGMGDYATAMLVPLILNIGIELVIRGTGEHGHALIVAALVLMCVWAAKRRRALIDGLKGLPVLGPRLHRL